MKGFYIILLLLTCSSLFSQKVIELQAPGDKYDKKCASCVAELKNLADTADFGVFSDDSLNVYFYTTSKEGFEKIFVKKYGIVTDIITRSQFSCERNGVKYDLKALNQGKLMPAIYGKHLQKRAKMKGDSVVVLLGALPAELAGQEFELNIVLVNKKLRCKYIIQYNLDSYEATGCELGMFSDTTIYKATLFDFDSTALYDNTLCNFKTTIYEKPMSVGDAQMVYDSLDFKKFRIDSALILIEHQPYDFSVKNPKQKAKFSNELMKYIGKKQKSKIKTRVATAVNWETIESDVIGSTFEFLIGLSKEETLERMGQNNLAENMSEIFEPTIDAKIIFYGEEYGSLLKTSKDSLVLLFNKATARGDVKYASQVLNTALLRMQAKEFPFTFVEDFDIPLKKEYIDLLNQKASFSYVAENIDLDQTLYHYKELIDLDPDNRAIAYNMVSLKFDLWKQIPDSINPAEFNKEIKALANKNISSKLINKMFINYYINMADYYKKMKDARAYEKAQKYVYSYFKKAALTDAEKIGISQYFCDNGKSKWAIKLLFNDAKSKTATEDLVFYFISITIDDMKITNKSAYVHYLNNAFRLNPERTCKLFNANTDGGVSFQTLISKKVMKFDCTKCIDEE